MSAGGDVSAGRPGNPMILNATSAAGETVLYLDLQMYYRWFRREEATASVPWFETHKYGIELSGTTQTNWLRQSAMVGREALTRQDLMIDLYSICRRH